MKRRSNVLSLVLLALAALVVPASAQAAFGLDEVGVEFKGPGGAPALQAGSHPFAMVNRVDMNSVAVDGSKELPEGALKDLVVDLPPGLAGDPLVVPRCSASDFAKAAAGYPLCPNSTAVGIASLKFSFSPFAPGEESFIHVPVYSLVPPPGVAMKLGFYVLGVPVTVDALVNPDPPYNVQAHATNISQAALFYSSVFTLWGDPASSSHDALRGTCLSSAPSTLDKFESVGECPVSSEDRKAFLTLPRSCIGDLTSDFSAVAWNTGDTDTKSALTPGMVGCPELGFEPHISASPTTVQAESPSGLDFNLQVDDEELTNPSESARAQSDIKKAVVTLPEGVTINPSQAQGLEACSEQDLARETVTSEFGAGCPAASKIGSVEVESKLLEGEILKGSLFVAEPYTNRFGSLLAIYQVIKSPKFGIAVKLAGEVKPDPQTGQITTTFDDLPQLPFSDFRLHFRGGERSPLVTPGRCGDYEVEAVFTPWADPSETFTTTAPFQITQGTGGGPCPSAGASPFEPGFSAGTENKQAGSYSPLLMRLTRRDGDQDLTRFDTALPPGLTAKLAGVARCSDQAIAEIKGKTGKAELASPSCPANSRIGSVLAGAGVGPQPTYVRGSVYLAGPVGKAPLSVVGVVPAVAGPFDIGTVVVRQALSLNPVTAEARVDSALSEPFPRILAGIPLKVRDIRVEVDRPGFTLNPTNCSQMAIGAALWGGGSDPFSVADDAPFSLSQRFQAANCSGLGFRPKLSFRLTGGTKRTANPALRAVVSARPGDANIGKAVVALPRSLFLEQSHIRTICTRVQFAAQSCPAGSIYGRAQAVTPLLDEPLEGPVYLRSSNNPLPDLVADLRGIVNIEVIGRIDSVKGGGIRSTFASVPDAPVSKFTLSMQGGKKSLLVNSRNLCAKQLRVKAKLTGQNGAILRSKPLLKTSCPKKSKTKKRRR